MESKVRKIWEGGGNVRKMERNTTRKTVRKTMNSENKR